MKMKIEDGDLCRFLQRALIDEGYPPVRVDQIRFGRNGKTGKHHAWVDFSSSAPAVAEESPWPTEK